jgi:hypothetical protein
MTSMPLRGGVALVAALLLGACATHRLAHHGAESAVANPARSVMVVGVTYDKVLRRVYEDTMAAKLATRGVKAVVSYEALPDGRVEEAQLREAVSRAQVDAVLITREGAIERSRSKISGGTVAVGTSGIGMYGWYSGTWVATEYAPTRIEGAAWSSTTSRLFDAREGTLLWTGAVESSLERGRGVQMERLVQLLFDGMVADRML